MPELTTIEKIDAMLAALDEGTRGPYREIAQPLGVMGKSCGRESLLGHSHAVGAGAELVICHIRFDESPHNKDARNIAWLLNAARPMLEAARETYTIHKDKASADAFRYMDATTTDIIAPLWKAFTEAEHD